MRFLCFMYYAKFFVYHLIYSSFNPQRLGITITPIIWMRKLRLGNINFLPKFTQLVNGRSGEKIKSGSKPLSSTLMASSPVEFCEMSVVIPEVSVILTLNILEVRLLEVREKY